MTGQSGTALRVQGQELTYLVNLASPAYSLLSNWVGLNAGLFARFHPLGLQPDAINWEGKSSHPKDLEVVCYLHDWNTVLRLRLMSIYLWTKDERFLRGRQSPVQWIEDALGAIREAGASSELDSQTVGFAYHGSLEDGTIADRIAGYVANAPGDLVPAGVRFRGNPASTANGHIELQPSFVYPGPAGAFVNVSFRGATKATPGETFQGAQSFHDEALLSLGLTLKWD